VVVLVGRNLDIVVETRSLVEHILFFGVPLLLLVAGVTTWFVVGRSLAPVEAIRSRVAEISGSALGQRVPAEGRDEIARLAATMNDMLSRLEEARARERRFVSDASHELRSPIAAIRQIAEVALAHPEVTSLEDLANEVLIEDERLQLMAEDLLLLARADEGALSIKAVPLDLDDLVFEEARRLRQRTTLRIDTGEVTGGRTVGDKELLRRVVRNLAENAARHADSAVRFAVSESDGRVLLEIDDDGAGIPDEAREQIFERFSRLDDARSRDRGGAGLGLAIVAEILAAHGGHAHVDEAPLGGARFQVSLPRSP
jgi:signal transduction histidine kinase